MDTDGAVAFIRSCKEQRKLTEKGMQKAQTTIKEQQLTGQDLAKCDMATSTRTILGLGGMDAINLAGHIHKLQQGDDHAKTEGKMVDAKPVKVDLANKFDPRTAEPATDLTQLDLKTILWVHWSEGGLGSTGVFFAKLKQGWVVMKPVTSDSAGEIYAAILGNKMGIHCPQFVVPSYEEQHALRTGLSLAPQTNPADKHRLHNARIQGFVIMSYIHGLPLPSCGMAVLPAPSGPQVLRDIGKMLVLDMVTNNHDRIPLAHLNMGNLANVMLEGDVRKPDNDFRGVSIDQSTICITDEENTGKYRDTMREAVQDAMAENLSGPALTRVKKSFLEGTGFELEAKHLKCICDGVKDGIESLRTLVTDTPDVFAVTLTTTKELLQPVSVLDNGSLSLSVDFISTNAQVVLDAAAV
eukprot:TRINITY_DN10579_c0_g1_i1.p2 TRINITY_DN10579_c0_g1~~TRINITY_DN10579_c0_g1_i1.p2  ORF type:complete len:427 (+),score=94.07 TRINITY_DN10579_c0_g1_i1:50-1282(+)